MESLDFLPQSTYRGRVDRNMGSVFVLSAGVYTTTLYVMVDRVKGGGRAPPPSPAWANFSIIMEYKNRVDSVLGFFSSRPNCEPPSPSPAGECVPFLWFHEGYTLAYGRGDGGAPIWTRGQTLWYYEYICTLCVLRVSY